MWLAAAIGSTAAITALAELGADVDAANNMGITPLYVAALAGHCETMRELVRLGADPNGQRESDRATPLLATVVGSQIEAMHEMV